MTTPDNSYIDPELMDSQSYHSIVGPALKAAADVAADRGDPTLAADMPCMLALIDMITCLSTGQHGTDEVDQDAPLTGTSAAACVMVMQEAKLDEPAIGHCLAALETAYNQLVKHDVTGQARRLIQHGGKYLRSGDREAGQAYLKQATQHIVACIEAWREQVH